MSKKRKTYTSPEVKNRWNAQHYDIMRFHAPKGSADEVRAIAAARGMSVAAYIRHLIIADNAEKPETTHFLRGGGVLKAWCEQVKDLLPGS